MAIISGKKVRYATVFAGILVLLWSFIRHIPVVASDSVLSGAWTNAGKALTLFGGFWAIAASFPKEKGKNTPLLKFLNLGSEFIILARICLGIFLFISGIQHFMATEFVASLIPGWFPGDAVFEALAVSGIAFVIAGYLIKHSTGSTGPFIPAGHA